MLGEIEVTDGDDDEVARAWVRLSDDEQVGGVEVIQLDGAAGDEWPFQVQVWAAEFVRTDPLESRLRHAVDAAARSVPGVTRVAEQDREVWIVAGHPDGQALTRAIASAIDHLADDIRAYLADDEAWDPLDD